MNELFFNLSFVDGLLLTTICFFAIILLADCVYAKFVERRQYSNLEKKEMYINAKHNLDILEVFYE